MKRPRRHSAKALAAAAILLLGGCESMDRFDAWIKENPDKVRFAVIGGLGGAVAGSVLGGGQTAMAIGAGTGLVLGWNAADYVFPKDETAFDGAVQKAATASTGERIAWDSPETGNSGRLTPVREAEAGDDGAPCREIEAAFDTESGTSTTRRIVCLGDDGRWRVGG